MRKIFILFAAFSLLLFAGCAQTVPTDDAPLGGTEQITPSDDHEEITKMFITVNGNKLEVELAQNSSVDELVTRLKNGDITFTASENGGFEIYGSIGPSLPTNNVRMTSEVGDVLLYAGNNICIFFGSNFYSYTRLGKINGYSAAELRTLVGAENGKVQVTISLK